MLIFALYMQTAAFRRGGALVRFSPAFVVLSGMLIAFLDFVRDGQCNDSQEAASC
jgi:hypothetical protein